MLWIQVTNCLSRIFAPVVIRDVVSPKRISSSIRQLMNGLEMSGRHTQCNTTQAVNRTNTILNNKMSKIRE